MTSYLRDVLAARGVLLGPTPEAMYDRLEREETELEAALETADEQEPDLGLEAASVLRGFWFQRGRVERGRYWVERMLKAAGPARTPARATGLVALASLAFRQGDNQLAKASSEAAIADARMLGRRDIEVDALLRRAEEGLRDEDPIAVRSFGAQARRLAVELSDERQELAAIHRLAEAARMAGDLVEARELYMESLQRNRALGDRLLVAVELSNLGYVEKAAGQLNTAEANQREAIRIALEVGSVYLLGHNLVALGAIVAAAGRYEEAVRIIGKGDSLLRDAGLMLDPADKPEHDAALDAARATLGDKAFDAGYAAGSDLDPATLGG